MKKAFPLLALAGATLAAVTACGPSPEEAFLDDYRDRVPSSANISDEQLLGTAKSICHQLEEGLSLEEIRNRSFENYMGGTLDAEAVNRIVSGTEAAAQQYCPEAVASDG